MKSRTAFHLFLSFTLTVFAAACGDHGTTDPAVEVPPVSADAADKGGGDFSIAALTEVITNGLPPADPDHFSVAVSRGGSSNRVIQDGTDVMFSWQGLLDLGALGVYFVPSFATADPVLLDPHTALTTSSIPTPGGSVDVEMLFEIEPGSEFVTLTTSITSDFDLTGARFFEYADLDILGLLNHFAFTGSIAGGDLVLAQTDGPGSLLVERVAGAGVTGFAADRFPVLLNNIAVGGFDPPPTGDVRISTGDVTSAFEFELAGASAALRTALGSDPSLVLDVSIDIKPGSDPNSVNPGSRGVIPVAILTTSTADGEDVDFDAATVDPATVSFGPDAAPPVHESGHLEDVDGDGDTDLVFHFRTQQTGIVGDTEEACINGRTVDDEEIAGCDAVNPVPRRGRGG